MAGEAEAAERRTGRAHDACKIGRVRIEEQRAPGISKGFMICYNFDNENGIVCQRDRQERDGP